MDLADLLLDLYGRVREHVDGILDGLSVEDLSWRPEAGANPIGWLVWHLTRVEDGHIGELLEADQLWVSGDWGPRFGVTSDPGNHGWGHTAEQVAAIRPESVDALREYHAVVAERTDAYLRTVTEADLGTIVDRRWDPPVTLGVRLVSIADDEIQHAGQAAYLKGLLERSR